MKIEESELAKASRLAQEALTDAARRPAITEQEWNELRTAATDAQRRLHTAMGYDNYKP